MKLRIDPYLRDLLKAEGEFRIPDAIDANCSVSLGKVLDGRMSFPSPGRHRVCDIDRGGYVTSMEESRDETVIGVFLNEGLVYLIVPGALEEMGPAAERSGGQSAGIGPDEREAGLEEGLGRAALPGGPERE